MAVLRATLEGTPGAPTAEEQRRTKGRNAVPALTPPLERSPLKESDPLTAQLARAISGLQQAHVYLVVMPP